MSVRCLGDCRLVEQVGEKQDFECVLTAQGVGHEDFVLRVRRVANHRLGPEWSSDYSVTIVRLATRRRRVYLGGPAHEWVQRFAADLARGAYDRRDGEVVAASRAPRLSRSVWLSSEHRQE